MKQFLILILALFSAYSLADSNTNEFEKFKSVKFMIYEGTLLTELDYKSADTLRSFEDYDFTVESSPCTVLGDYYDAKDDNNTIYTVKVGEKDFRFMCRSVNGMKEDNRRLYMLGSVHDCLNRSFDYSKSHIDDYKYFGSMCQNENRKLYQAKVDYSYLELFHPDKYYRLLALNVR